MTSPETWHRLTDVNPDMRTATCSKCGANQKIAMRSGKWRCTTPLNAHARQNHAKAIDRRRQNRLAILASQQFKCAVCSTPIDDGDLDHDHQTDYIRGVLCTPCNVGIGMFFDDPVIMRNAADYIEHHAKRTDKRVTYSYYSSMRHATYEE
jgi:hypothetical protein